MTDRGKTIVTALFNPAAALAAFVALAVATANAQTPAAVTWNPSDINRLRDDTWGGMVRLGRELMAHTSSRIGPEVSDVSKRYAGNNLDCQSCHLKDGVKQFGLPYVGVYADFPQYRSREGEVGTIEDRINGCMTRSMNGRALPLDSVEMKAMVAYIKFLSQGVPVGAPTRGRGSGAMNELDRAADPGRGKQVFAQVCAQCHGADGQGKRHGMPGDAKGYEFPPLWGADSFNDGAGMDRLIAGANFVHSNMPYGVTFENPLLSVEDAWDVMAYVQSMPRPHKANLDKDFPVRAQKPVDAGYGPYIDGFDQKQHRLGPFAPIRAAVKSIAEGKK